MINFDILFPEMNYSFPMALVKGTGDTTYLFGVKNKADIHINDFFISKFLITQKLWEYIMGNNPSHFVEQDRPVDNVSFNDITEENGFLVLRGGCHHNGAIHCTVSKRYEIFPEAKDE